MPSELSTSVIKSPPLDVGLTGSWGGGMVSAAICRGPGGAAINFSDWAAGMGLATTDGVTAAAAPTKPAPLRKLRRLALGQRCLDISSCRLRQRPIWPVLAIFSSGVPGSIVPRRARGGRNGRRASVKSGEQVLRNRDRGHLERD